MPVPPQPIGRKRMMARGNQGQKIYADDADREMWLATLVQAWQRTGWRPHAWGLNLLGLQVEDLPRLPKGQTEKMVLA